MSARVIPKEAVAPLPPVELDRARVQRVMENVRQLEVRTRRLVDNAMSGSYHSAFRGRGIDFDQVREYVPGDEVRTIDWNVTARAGRPFVKQFREERELTLLLVVDVSASGDFGSAMQRKRDLAAELACVLALSATRNNDLVALLMFSDRIERYVPPRKGRDHAQRIVREILGCTPRGRGTDVPAVLEIAGSLLTQRAVVALISDLELGGDRTERLAALERAARPLGARHDLIALHVRDPHERGLPNVGLIAVEDAETGEVLFIDTARNKVRERFTAVAEQRAQEVRDALLRCNADVVEIDTGQQFVRTLHGFFTQRGRRAA